MTIKRKLSILNLAILLLLTLVLVMAGTLVINKILFQLNERLMNMELSNRIAILSSSNQTLEESGLAGMGDYVNNAQAEALASFSRYVFGKNGFLLVVKDTVKLSGPEFKSNIVNTYKVMNKGNGIIRFSDGGRQFFCVYSRFEPWMWSLGLIIPLEELTVQRNVYLRTVTVIALAVMMVSFFVFAAFANRIIVNPINEIALRLKEIAAGGGDLRNRLKIQTNDEIGSLASSFNLFVEKLQNMIREIAENTITLSASSEELSATSLEITDHADSMKSKYAVVATSSGSVSTEIKALSLASTDMSASIVAVAAAAEEMSISLNEIAKSCQHESQMSESVKQQAEEIKKTILQLNSSAQDITKVITVIKKLAAQTNLLSLNAAIEAASAGDAGKGFGVVASEVKELARQTENATEAIQSQVQAVQQNVTTATKALEKITSLIVEVNSASQSIVVSVEVQNTVVSDLAKNINNASLTSHDIASNVSRSASELHTVANSIEQVNVAVEDTTRGITEVKEYAGRLAKMASDLQSIVSQFKI